MYRSFRMLGSAVAATVLTAGCHCSPWAAGPPSGTGPNAPATVGPGFENPASPAPTANPQAMQEVMAELRQLGAEDPTAQEELIAELQQIDPAWWQDYLYRRRAAHQAAQAVAGDASGYSSRLDGAFDPRGNRLPPARDAALAPRDAPSGEYPNTLQPPIDAGRINRTTANRQVFGGPDEFNRVARDSLRDDCQAHLITAARFLESQSEDPPGPADSPDQLARQARLRLLYLLAGQREEALRSIPGSTPSISEFWTKQIYALDTWLDTKRIPDPTDRAAATKQILEEATAELGESAPLVIRNLAFCTTVHNFGYIESFKNCAFQPGQEVLLYAEVENFATESSREGYHTALKSSYRIFDAQGRPLVDDDLPINEDYCQNLRHDFFFAFRLYIPQHIYPGEYTLKLTIEDLKSRKIGQSSIKFTVEKPAERGAGSVL